MTSAFTPLAALTIDHTREEIFEAGDVAVIMKPDGSVKALSTGLDASRLESVPEEEYNDADRLAAAQGRKLLAVSLALSNPRVMEIMYAMLDDPAVTEALSTLAVRH